MIGWAHASRFECKSTERQFQERAKVWLRSEERDSQYQQQHESQRGTSAKQRENTRKGMNTTVSDEKDIQISEK